LDFLDFQEASCCDGRVSDPFFSLRSSEISSSAFRLIYISCFSLITLTIFNSGRFWLIIMIGAGLPPRQLKIRFNFQN